MALRDGRGHLNPVRGSGCEAKVDHQDVGRSIIDGRLEFGDVRLGVVDLEAGLFKYPTERATRHRVVVDDQDTAGCSKNGHHPPL